MIRQFSLEIKVMSNEKKIPFLFTVFNSQDDLEVLDNYFSSDENLQHMPEEVQDSIQYCRVIYDPNNKNSIIIVIDEIALKYIIDVLHRYNIIYEIRDITKSIYFGEYPFELDSEFLVYVNDVVFNLIGIDDILEKIKYKGINSLSQKELDSLKA